MLRATGAAPAAVDDVVVFLPEELIRPVRHRTPSSCQFLGTGPSLAELGDCAGMHHSAKEVVVCNSPNGAQRRLLLHITVLAHVGDIAMREPTWCAPR